MDSVTGTHGAAGAAGGEAAGGAADGAAIWVTFSRRATDGGGSACVGHGATACKYRDTCKWVGKPSEIQLCSSNDHGGVFHIVCLFALFCVFHLVYTHVRMHGHTHVRMHGHTHVRMHACTTHNRMRRLRC